MFVLLFWTISLIVPLKYFGKVPCYQLRSLWWSWTCLFKFCCSWASHLTLSLFPPLGSGTDNTHPNYLTGTLWKSWDDRCESTFRTTKCNPHLKSDYNDPYPSAVALSTLPPAIFSSSLCLAKSFPCSRSSLSGALRQILNWVLPFQLCFCLLP